MTFLQVYKKLFKQYGAQHWWPGETPFEVMVGAILTQNTAWKNVEYAITNLNNNNCLSPERILATPQNDLAQWIRPSGYFNVKSKRLKNYCQWYVDSGQYKELNTWTTQKLRRELLVINGVGPETADDILLYAFERPVFVVDTYTRRLFSRLKILNQEANDNIPYEDLRLTIENNLNSDATLFGEYHALIVQHAKQSCKKSPVCRLCCLYNICPSSLR